MVRLPGLIDAHVHLRDPGQTQKEDFFTGTQAALAGGFTTVIDMPNNAEPIISVERLKQKIEIAKLKTASDIGFHYGSMGDNLETFEEAAELAMLRAHEATSHLLLVTPGIRPAWAATNDQKRIVTPADAVRNGSDYLVIGRPITQPPAEIGGPRQAVEAIIKELQGVDL